MFAKELFSIRRVAIIFWIFVICIILLVVYFVYSLMMYLQVVQLLPTLDPDTGQLWLRFWEIEYSQALVLLIAFIPITAIIGIYLRVVPPSLDDYAREVAQENGKV